VRPGIRVGVGEVSGSLSLEAKPKGERIMKPTKDLVQPALPAPRRRFRLMRLEERIAPKKGQTNTKAHCSGSGASGSTTDPSTLSY
jgi:hypothetical protein